MVAAALACAVAAALVAPTAALGAEGASPLVDTGQGTCYDDSGE